MDLHDQLLGVLFVKIISDIFCKIQSGVIIGHLTSSKLIWRTPSHPRGREGVSPRTPPGETFWRFHGVVAVDLRLGPYSLGVFQVGDFKFGPHPGIAEAFRGQNERGHHRGGR